MLTTYYKVVRNDSNHASVLKSAVVTHKEYEKIYEQGAVVVAAPATVGLFVFDTLHNALKYVGCANCSVRPTCTHCGYSVLQVLSSAPHNALKQALIDEIPMYYRALKRSTPHREYAPFIRGTILLDWVYVPVDALIPRNVMSETAQLLRSA